MEKLVEILKSFATGSGPAPKPGFLSCRTEEIPEAQDAMERFLAFGGEGWLCAADSPETRRFSPGSPPVVGTREAWIVCGEAARGDTSMHVQRSGDVWKLTEIRRAGAESQSDVLVNTVFRSRDDRGDLIYETSWRKTGAGGIEEMRPVAFRFAGFASRGKEE